jgi:glycerol uptake operon antiterminator
MGLIEKLELNPIIAAVKDEKTLREALNSDIEVIFLLKSTILTIEAVVEKIKKTGKMVFVHIDLIDGMSPTVDALDYLNEKTKLDGIISTKSALIKEKKTKITYNTKIFYLGLYIV